MCSCAFEGGNDIGGVYAGENASGWLSHLNDETVATDLGVTVVPVLRLSRDSIAAHDRSKRIRTTYLHAYQVKISPDTDPDVNLEVRVARNNSNIFESPSSITLTDISRAHRLGFIDAIQGHRLQLEFTHNKPTRVVLECHTTEYLIQGSRLQ
jgi:hypothetical protein